MLEDKRRRLEAPLLRQVFCVKFSCLKFFCLKFFCIEFFCTKFSRSMATGPTAKFNNATQRLFGDLVEPVVYVWETNDPDAPWHAQARILQGGEVFKKFEQTSATEKKTAKNLAADTAYQALCAQYPNVDLTTV